MLFCALLCPPPGGAAGFPPAGPVHLADGFRLASRRAGGSAAFGGCAPSGLGIYGASPAPSPGVLFPRRKSTQKGDKRERDFDFPLPLITPSPLNDQRGLAPFGFPRGDESCPRPTTKVPSTAHWKTTAQKPIMVSVPFDLIIFVSQYSALCRFYF